VIRLDDPKRIENVARGAKTEAAIRLANPAKPLILVDVHLNGRGPFQFAVETGTSTSAVTPKLAKQLGLTTSEIPSITGSGDVAVISARRC
jgi:predicted aspartyl protease